MILDLALIVIGAFGVLMALSDRELEGLAVLVLGVVIVVVRAVLGNWSSRRRKDGT